MLPRAAVILVSVITAFVMLAELWTLWSSTHPLDIDTYKLRCVINTAMHCKVAKCSASPRLTHFAGYIQQLQSALFIA
jgi:hypothetical protein